MRPAKEREQRAHVRAHELDAGVAAEGAIEDHVGHRPGGIELKLKERIGHAHQDVVGDTFRLHGMYRDHRASPAELLEYRLELGVAQVDAVAVTEELHAVGVQDVEGVGDLLQGGLHVGHGQGGVEAEPVRVSPHRFGRHLVGISGEGTGRSAIAPVDVRGGDAQDRCAYVHLVHILDLLLHVPRRQGEDIGKKQTRVGEPLAIGGWDVMGMNVDCWNCCRCQAHAKSLLVDATCAAYLHQSKIAR